MEWHMIFLSVICYIHIHQWKYQRNEASKKNFGTFCSSINPLVKLLWQTMNHRREFFRWIIFIREPTGKICANGLWVWISIKNYVRKSKNSGNAYGYWLKKKFNLHHFCKIIGHLKLNWLYQLHSICFFLLLEI
jgi:hypothetical protein